MDEVPYRASRLLRVLSNPLTYQIVGVLRRGPARPGLVAAELDRHRATISRLGRELKLAEVIRYETGREEGGGRVVSYRLKDENVLCVVDAAEEFIRRTRTET